MDKIIVAVVVLVALGFIVRRVSRAIASARAPKGGCSDCGSNSAGTSNDWVAPL